MAHALDDPLAKTGWAEKHLAQLNTEKDLWVQSHPYYVADYPNADKTFWKFSVHRFDEPIKPESDHFGLIIGDYVHNLRSALDHLVWQLVTVANGKAIKRRTAREIYFPIISKRGHPRDFWASPAVSHLTLKQSLILEGFQPYHGGHEASLIGDLHDLWIADKHKLITDVAVTLHRNGPVFKYTDTQLVKVEWDSTVRLKGDAEIAWVTVYPVGDNPKVSVKWLPVDVAVGEAGRLIQELDAMLPLVRTIIFSCEEFFR